MNILILNGHDNFGNGGAENEWFGSEQLLTREFAQFLKDELEKVGNIVTIYNPTIQNTSAYTDLKKNSKAIKFHLYDYVIELHFNAKGGVTLSDGIQLGSEILIHKKAQNLVKAHEILQSVSKAGLRTRSVVKRDDLYVMNTAYSYNVPYMLWEICFIDDNDDMGFYSTHRRVLAKAFAKNFQNEANQYSVVVGDNDLLVMSDEKGDVLKNIPNHSIVILLDIVNDKAKISYDGVIGYVPVKKLYKISNQTIIDDVDIKENAYNGSKTVTKLKKGNVVKVMFTRKSATGETWYYVISQYNIRGFIPPNKSTVIK